MVGPQNTVCNSPFQPCVFDGFDSIFLLFKGQGNLKKHNVEAVLRMADSIEPNVEYNVDLDLVEGWLASLHQQFLLVEVIFGLALAAYAGFFLNRNLRRLEPMDPLQLLQTLFSALPQGSMMVSYRWDDRLAAQVRGFYLPETILLFLVILFFLFSRTLKACGLGALLTGFLAACAGWISTNCCQAQSSRQPSRKLLQTPASASASSLRVTSKVLIACWNGNKSKYSQGNALFSRMMIYRMRQ